MKSQSLSTKFFKIGLICRSVICCRVTGRQKSQVVSLIKRKGNWITLAVGDGTNDVPMLMEAHIGVGVQGKEGTQAVRSSDYAICQFRFLQRLLLIHGRNGYRRISTFICYYFYKNIILVFAEIYFVFFSGFSGQPFFPDFLPILYNSVWTSWPCIFAFSIESDLIDHTYKKMGLNLLKNKNNLLGKYFEILPAFYRAGQVRYYFNLKVFWLWLFSAILHGGLAYLFITTGITNHAVWGDGRLIDHWWISTVIFSSIIHIVTYKIFVETTYWNKLIILTSVLSIFVYYISIYIINMPFVSFAVQNELAKKVTSMFISRTYWIYTISLPVFIISIDLIVKFVYRFYNPNPLDLVKLKKVAFKDSENIIEKISTMKNPQDKFKISQKNIFEHNYNKPNLEMAKL
jgi:phospholipid-transporting ATPase